MTSAILGNLPPINLQAKDPEEKLITSGVSWEAYETLITALGESSGYRVAYLEGTLEIMSPSRNHEIDKKNIRGASHFLIPMFFVLCQGHKNLCKNVVSLTK